MKTIVVKTSLTDKKTGKRVEPVETLLRIGETLEETLLLLGGDKDMVNHFLIAKLKGMHQTAVRERMRRGQTQGEIRKGLKEHYPSSVRGRPSNKVRSAIIAWKGMTIKERKALLEEMGIELE